MGVATAVVVGVVGAATRVEVARVVGVETAAVEVFWVLGAAVVWAAELPVADQTRRVLSRDRVQMSGTSVGGGKVATATT